MYTVSVSQPFQAKHFLIGGDWGPENQVHSHAYRFEILVFGKRLDEHEYLVDITLLEGFLNQQIDRYRDQTLNQFPDFNGLNPSLEAFARIVCHALASLIFPQAQAVERCEVKIWESESAWASFELGR
jgi:6-pyruvoyltetrahydropterin/6-carboxytetrahydropterin synthase